MENIETKKFFRNEFEVKFILIGEFETFNDYREVFEYFNRFDYVYSRYKRSFSIERAPFRVLRQHTRVTSISQGSLEIGLFIEKHWLELFLLFLASYKDIKQNSKEAFGDFNNLVDNVESTIKEVTSDFPRLEREQISAFINWFNMLTIENQNYIRYHIKAGYKVFKKIKKIILKR